MEIEPETTSRFGAGLLGHRTFRQLVKFGLVGASGFIINVSVFAFCLRVLGVHYRLAYVFAFGVAVTNNFCWNRLWTFRHQRDGSHMAMQGARFFAVSLLAAIAGFVLLEVFVRAGLAKIPSEMLAVTLVVPISFLGNKHWSFRHRP
jgi:putative flippase GtrA